MSKEPIPPNNQVPPSQTPPANNHHNVGEREKAQKFDKALEEKERNHHRIDNQSDEDETPQASIKNAEEGDLLTTETPSKQEALSIYHQATMKSQPTGEELPDQPLQAGEEASSAKNFYSLVDAEGHTEHLSGKKPSSSETELPASIFDLSKGAQKPPIKKEPPSTHPSFQQVPTILGFATPPQALSEGAPVASIQSLPPVEQIANIISQSVETLAVRQVGGTTEVLMQLNPQEVPEAFASASLTVSHQAGRIDIQFDQFANADQQQMARQLVEQNLNTLLASLSQKNIGVGQLTLGGQEVALPEQYVAHLAAMQASIPLEELLFGKKQSPKDSAESIEAARRAGKSKQRESFPPVDRRGPTG